MAEVKAPLTKSEKLEAIRLLEEQARRNLVRKPKYKPHAEQLGVHKCEAQQRFVLSGNGYGKTTLLVNEIWWAATGVNPVREIRTGVPARIAVVLDNSNKIRDVIIPELRKWFEIKEEWLRRDGKPYVSRIEHDNGSTVTFYTTEADPMVFEGVQFTDVFIDEPLPRNLYVALLRSLRIKGRPGKLLFCGTPVTEAWLRTEIYEPWLKGELPGIECFRGNTEANLSNLDPSWYETFSRALSEAERDTRLRGGFFDSEGMALAHLWDRKLHIVPEHKYIYDKRSPCAIAVDPHPQKKHTAINLCADNEGLKVIGELSLKQVPRVFARSIADWMEGFNVMDIVIDNYGSGEMTGGEGFLSFIEVINDEFKNLGLKIRARPTSFHDKSDDGDWVTRLQENLLIPNEPDNFGRKLPKLQVLSNCSQTIREIENATWEKNKRTGILKRTIDITQKDMLSCLKYALSTGLCYNSEQRRKPFYYSKPAYGFDLTPARQNQRRLSYRRKR